MEQNNLTSLNMSLLDNVGYFITMKNVDLDAGRIVVIWPSNIHITVCVPSVIRPQIYNLVQWN